LSLISVNQRLLDLLNPQEVEVVIRLAGETEAEADEMWSFVQRKRNQRWFWHAIDHRSGQVLAYVFGRRQDEGSGQNCVILYAKAESFIL
jgi:insertion element IS1 protein InsB